MTQAAPDDALASVDFVVVEFADGRAAPGGFERPLALVDQGIIAILDVEFLRRDVAGVRTVPVAEVPTTAGVDLSVWDGSSSRLLDDDDLTRIGEQMSDGAIVVVVVFENLWVLDVIGAWTEAGGRLLLDGGMPATDLLAALDAAEAE
ncbi:MAG: DUF6325 family protein [Jiangellales bacterium]